MTLKARGYELKSSSLEPILTDLFRASTGKKVKKRYTDYAYTWETNSKGFDHCVTTVNGEITKEAKWLSSRRQGDGSFDSNEISVLSLYFTIVKIVFLTGYLDFLPALINLIEPLR